MHHRGSRHFYPLGMGAPPHPLALRGFSSGGGFLSRVGVARSRCQAAHTPGLRFNRAGGRSNRAGGRSNRDFFQSAQNKFSPRITIPVPAHGLSIPAERTASIPVWKGRRDVWEGRRGVWEGGAAYGRAGGADGGSSAGCGGRLVSLPRFARSRTRRTLGSSACLRRRGHGGAGNRAGSTRNYSVSEGTSRSRRPFTIPCASSPGE
jgi:hypothetical protein